MATRQEHIDGILAALNADEKIAYSADSLPDVLPPYYVEVHLSRRFGGVQRFGGDYDGRLYRILVRAVARTLPNAYRMWDALDDLEGTVLIIGSTASTLVEFETEDEQIRPDAGWYSGARTLTYALI
jgi:hypothetical protein